MNYLTIIQFLGFYVISSFGIYYFLLTYDVEDVTLLDIFIILSVGIDKILSTKAYIYFL